jgi:chromosome segregation protein
MQAAQARISATNEKLAEINRQMVGKSSRLGTLKEMADAHEGFFEGVRSVMEARKHNMLKGHYAVVADVITVPQGFETAIEVALGSAVQDIITDTVDDAKQAIRFLKENRAGRATFLPLDGIRPQVSSSISNLNQPGVEGLANEIISFDRKYSPAINILLGRVVIVDNIDNAVKLSRTSNGWGRIVTLDGEVIVPTGAMTGGARQSKGANLLGRKQEMDSLAKEVSNLDSARKKIELEIESAKNALENAQKIINELTEATASDNMALADAERQVDFVLQERHRIERQVEVVSAEKEEVELAMESDSAALAALEADLSVAGQENLDLDAFVAESQKKVEDLTARREGLSSDLMEMSVTLASLRERRTGFEQSIRQTSGSISDMESELKARIEEVRKQASDATENVREQENLAAQAAESDKKLQIFQTELENLLTRRSTMAQSNASVDAEMKALHHARSETAELLRDCDVKEARLDVQINQTADRLFEEYEISREEALAREEMIELERGTATEIARLRKEIKSMGPVNTGAIQEYERIKERWEFLTTQKSDLEEARVKLQDAIHEIDLSTQGLFMTTFNAIGEHFDKMFKQLFNGGKTELVLTDPSNLLETGVEVIVQPPGKKLQNLNLLSGGERALTASALLFALLLVKPSPFVMFDEVDAPLDDTNVERFADVLKEFSKNSQFIVVTHNRSTMEAADTLYGVTMQEPGISKLISVRLTDEAERKKTGSEVVYVQ